MEREHCCDSILTRSKCLCSTGLIPAISPPGFNASEDAGAVVVFTCELPPDVTLAYWVLNGSTTFVLGLAGVLERHGITYDELQAKDGKYFIRLNISQTADNDGTLLQCHWIVNDVVEKSEEVEFRVQGR